MKLLMRYLLYPQEMIPPPTPALITSDFIAADLNPKQHICNKSQNAALLKTSILGGNMAAQGNPADSSTLSASSFHSLLKPFSALCCADFSGLE